SADVYSAEVGLVALDMESVVHPVPFLSNGALLFHDSGISPSNAGAAVPDLEILQLLPDSPQFQQVTFNDVDDFIVDANQGWALIQQQQRGGNSSTMALLNVEQPNSQAVVPLPTSDTGGIIFDLGDEVMSHLSRVEPGAAIWLSESGLILWTEQQGARRLTEERVQFPDLEQGRVVWSMWKDNGTRAVQLWDGQRVRQVSASTADVMGTALITETHLFWSERSPTAQVVAYDLATETMRTVHEGSCLVTDAEGDSAVFVCSEDSEPSVFTTPSSLWLTTEGRTRRVRDAAILIAARLHGQRLAWAEYDGPDAWCQGFAEGRLMVAGLEQEEPLEVDTIGSGCWCCGAIWPPLKLELDEEHIAWNYALTDESSPRGGSIGYAKLAAECP
ncbi:MAG: hypothetical protein AAFS10_27250, partial [Myxococcota bacterium]